MANVQFDADGDILLLLGDILRGSARFQVSSHALCLTSPVFRAMLGANGKFKESKDLQGKKSGEPPVEITLHDDDPEALAVILRIVHHQHDCVPESLSEANLWQIAILVDKYDLREATKLWINLWIKPYLDQAGLPLASSSYFTGDKGIFLAYAFGNEVLFKSISKNIILTWKSTPSEHLERPSPLLCPEPHMGQFEPLLRRIEKPSVPFKFVPQSIVGIYISSFHFIGFYLQKALDELYQTRKAYVEEISKCISRYISMYSGSPDESRSSGVFTSRRNRVQCCHNNELCDSFVLGILVRKLSQYQTVPIYDSISKIRATLAEIKPHKNAFFDNNSSGCCIKPKSCKCSNSYCRECKEGLCERCGQSYQKSSQVNHAACFLDNRNRSEEHTSELQSRP